MRNFTAILASTAAVFGSAEAAKSLHMYDPMTLSQSYESKPTQFAQVISEGKKDTPAAATAAPAKAAPAAPKSDPATDAALKKKWCVENVESTFFNADGAPRSALE